MHDDATVSLDFTSEAAASVAVRALLAAGFDPERDITVVATPHPRGATTREDVAIPYTNAWMSASNVGAAVGAGLGAVVAGAVASGVVDAPPGVFRYGLAAALLQGGLLGLGTGWLTGLIAGLGAWKQEAEFDVGRGRAEAVRVAVHATGARATFAAEVLEKAGGQLV